ncbi:DNA glycosylase AlkZ-like family protein [Cellulomonas fengjieae]|uniref:DNA glycosylase AlkZ-like family protein n=1 Tax=Cellulomonas fengjieae TaxID=2819978 RepID=UPI001AAFF8DC|nr:crosslink repair DNA glycosylase YcaQ family protein [Cellulomonas fengjieae]MBO3103154.1 winged helix DNA-binding domain-containing protein [Cellulomonas fengjieae]
MSAITRDQVRRYRVHAQQLDRSPRADRRPDDAVILDLGVQDTGPDGALWALALRGVPVGAHAWPHELALSWTVRAAPHAYRRADLAEVEQALRPYSEADAAKRVLSAGRPLADAGIAVLDALATVSRTMRAVVDAPLDKGTLSTRMTAELPGPYLRWCAACGATHMYEMPFRLAALHAGLDLEPDTSPPVIRRIPGWPAAQVGMLGRTTAADDGRVDVLRALLHLLGPLTPRQAADYLDAAVRDVTARWPQDVVDVTVEGRRASMLDADLTALSDPPGGPVVRLLGPYDLFLQGRDRDVVVPDSARHRTLWPTIGRPGAVLAGGEIIGTWRPRAKGRRLGLELDEWVPWSSRTRSAVDVEHERLAQFRGVTPA